MVETNIEAKVALNVNEFIKSYWPVMTFPLVVLFFIGIGAFIIAKHVSGELYMIITYWIFVLAGLILYTVSTLLFYNDVKKAIINPRLSKNQ